MVPLHSEQRVCNSVDMHPVSGKSMSSVWNLRFVEQLCDAGKSDMYDGKHGTAGIGEVLHDDLEHCRDTMHGLVHQVSGFP